MRTRRESGKGNKWNVRELFSVTKIAYHCWSAIEEKSRDYNNIDVSVLPFFTLFPLFTLFYMDSHFVGVKVRECFNRKS